MTLPPPDSHAMLFLAAVYLGEPIRTDDGALAVYVSPVGPQPVPVEALDWLEAGGYVDLGGDEPAVTEQGRYLVQRWAGKYWGKGVRDGGRGLPRVKGFPGRNY